MLALDPGDRAIQQRPIHPSLAPRNLVILRNPLVEPLRHVLHHGVQVAVRDLVPQVVGHAVAPSRVDRQLGVGLDEKRPAIGKLRIMQLDEPVEPLGALEQVDVDRLVRAGQRQPAAQVGPLRGQLLEQPMMRGHRKIAVDHQLVADQRVPIGQRQPAGQRARAAAKNEHDK